jgi:hypothetical protein
MPISYIETASLDTALNAPTATALSTASGSAPSYSARAWVNFNGTGTVAIRASGNVSSITDNGTGDYTVNFTTAMPDTNHCPTGIAAATAQLALVWDGDQTKTTTAYRFITLYPNTLGGGGAVVDANNVQIAIFR